MRGSDRINKKVLLVIAILLSFVISAYISTFLCFLLEGNYQEIIDLNFFNIITKIKNNLRILKLFAVVEVTILMMLFLFCTRGNNIYHSKTVKLTDKITVPTAIGQGQYGTSWWMKKDELNNIFEYNILDRNKEYKQSEFETGGVVVNYERKKDTEYVTCINKNLHVLLIGASR